MTARTKSIQNKAITQILTLATMICVCVKDPHNIYYQGVGQNLDNGDRVARRQANVGV